MANVNVVRLVAFALVAFTFLCWLLLTQTPHDSKAGGAAVNVNIKKASPVPESNFYVNAPKVECPEKWFDVAEIIKHNTEKDLWVLIHGYVLDVTKFLPNHPGGSALLNGAGIGDAEKLFEQFHQPGTVGIFKGFCIGKVKK